MFAVATSSTSTENSLWKPNLRKGVKCEFDETIYELKTNAQTDMCEWFFGYWIFVCFISSLRTVWWKENCWRSDSGAVQESVYLLQDHGESWQTLYAANSQSTIESALCECRYGCDELHQILHNGCWTYPQLVGHGFRVRFHWTLIPNILLKTCNGLVVFLLLTARV